MSEHNQQFDSFDQWIDKGSSWLKPKGRGIYAICFNAKGEYVNNGAGMMRSRDEGLFPVQWIWPDQVGSMIETAAERDRLLAVNAELVGALEYLIAEADQDMDDDYNPHSRPLELARAALAKSKDQP